jgi:hypothetical protein
MYFGEDRLAKNNQSKDEALETLDFIMNVLKEHEKDLDKVINELETVAEQFGKTGELTGKVEKVEEKISNLQKDFTKMINNLSSGAIREALHDSARDTVNKTTGADTATIVQGELSTILHCKQWEDFQTLAFQAQTLSFNYNDGDKVFQANALKGNHIITYSGPISEISAILKTWLSLQLGVPEKNIWEGVLELG